jgi:nucleotide-binding universal stress UspA family protein
MSMTRVRQILCATDFSPASEPAWQEALLLARLCHAELALLHVVPPVMFPPDGYIPPRVYQELVDAAHHDAHAGLERLVGQAADPRLKVRTRVEEGGPAASILEVAREEMADLVVLGTHGRTGVERLVLGSVADRVVRQASCPVLTVPARPGVATAGRLGRILYATDFSPAAREGWPWAVALAEAAGADIDLLHVTLAPVGDHEVPAERLGEMAQTLHEQGQAAAERFLRRYCPQDLARERVHVLIGRGPVAEQIAHWARSRSADLIVMGTHGWSGLLRWMLGSVAHHLLQTAPCPLLTVGPAGRDREARDDH